MNRYIKMKSKLIPKYAAGIGFGDALALQQQLGNTVGGIASNYYKRDNKLNTGSLYGNEEFAYNNSIGDMKGQAFGHLASGNFLGLVGDAFTIPQQKKLLDENFLKAKNSKIQQATIQGQDNYSSALAQGFKPQGDIYQSKIGFKYGGKVSKFPDGGFSGISSPLIDTNNPTYPKNKNYISVENEFSPYINSPTNNINIGAGVQLTNKTNSTTDKDYSFLNRTMVEGNFTKYGDNYKSNLGVRLPIEGNTSFGAGILGDNKNGIAPYFNVHPEVDYKFGANKYNKQTNWGRVNVHGDLTSVMKTDNQSQDPVYNNKVSVGAGFNANLGKGFGFNGEVNYNLNKNVNNHLTEYNNGENRVTGKVGLTFNPDFSNKRKEEEQIRALKTKRQEKLFPNTKIPILDKNNKIPNVDNTYTFKKGGILKYPEGGELPYKYQGDKYTNPRIQKVISGNAYFPEEETIKIDGTEDNAVTEHEKYHHWQKVNGNLRVKDVPFGTRNDRVPTMADNENDNFNNPNPYFNRRQVERDKKEEEFYNANKEFDTDFIPTDIAINKKIEPALYNDKNSVEGEARKYEEYIRKGGKSFTAFKKGGKIMKLNKYYKGGNLPKFADGGNLYEVEKGETVTGDNVQLEDGQQLSSNTHLVGGNTHENGGTLGMNGEKVYSNRSYLMPQTLGVLKQLKINVKPNDTHAKAAEVIGRKEGKFEKEMDSVNFRSKNTAKLMLGRYATAKEIVFNDQEMQKGSEQPMQQYADGGELPIKKTNKQLLEDKTAPTNEIKLEDNNNWNRYNGTRTEPTITEIPKVIPKKEVPKETPKAEIKKEPIILNNIKDTSFVDSFKIQNEFEKTKNRIEKNKTYINKLNTKSKGSVTIGEVLIADVKKGIVKREEKRLEKLNPTPSSYNINNYDIAPYATGNYHEQEIQKIYNNLKGEDKEYIDNYIKKAAPEESPITADMILNAAKKYNVDAKLMVAIMHKDSHFGRYGAAVQTKNAGNVGNMDDGRLNYKKDWQSGVDSVAQWLANHRVKKYAYGGYINKSKIKKYWDGGKPPKSKYEVKQAEWASTYGDSNYDYSNPDYANVRQKIKDLQNNPDDKEGAGSSATTTGYVPSQYKIQNKPILRYNKENANYVTKEESIQRNYTSAPTIPSTINPNLPSPIKSPYGYNPMSTLNNPNMYGKDTPDYRTQKDLMDEDSGINPTNYVENRNPPTKYDFTSKPNYNTDLPTTTPVATDVQGGESSNWSKIGKGISDNYGSIANTLGAISNNMSINKQQTSFTPSYPTVGQMHFNDNSPYNIYKNNTLARNLTKQSLRNSGRISDRYGYSANAMAANNEVISNTNDRRTNFNNMVIGANNAVSNQRVAIDNDMAQSRILGENHKLELKTANMNNYVQEEMQNKYYRDQVGLEDRSRDLLYKHSYKGVGENIPYADMSKEELETKISNKKLSARDRELAQEWYNYKKTK